MSLIVQKFGGTSLADIGMIKKVASRVGSKFSRGDDLIVIVSAMAGVTDDLIRLAYQVSSCPDKRELDVLLATGEQTTVSILTMMLKQMGYRAQSVLAHQIRIITDSLYGGAQIVDVEACKIKKIIQGRSIAVIAGFQGCDKSGNITTLGRGGSDTTAVAIAGLLQADLCEIYTDVDGIYTADPSLCPKARKLDKVSYDEMFQMAKLGTKVLHQDSIRFAKDYNIKLHVRSSFSFDEGTMIGCDNSVEGEYGVAGIAYDLDYAKIMLKGIPSNCNIDSKIILPITQSGILVNMMIQYPTANGRINFEFLVLKEEFTRALDIEKLVASSTGISDVMGTMDNAKVSAVGLCIKDYMRLASSIFRALRRESIDTVMTHASELEISCVIQEKYVGLAVIIFHSVLNLG